MARFPPAGWAGARGETIDYLSFVPDGEPTLDINPVHTIELLRPLGAKIAVITNSSLIGLEDVHHDLQKADWVSIKLDSVIENIWRRMNHPARIIEIEAIIVRSYPQVPGQDDSYLRAFLKRCRKYVKIGGHHSHESRLTTINLY